MEPDVASHVNDFEIHYTVLQEKASQHLMWAPSAYVACKMALSIYLIKIQRLNLERLFLKSLVLSDELPFYGQ
jgi:hypothetical protein